MVVRDHQTRYDEMVNLSKKNNEGAVLLYWQDLVLTSILKY